MKFDPIEFHAYWTRTGAMSAAFRWEDVPKHIRPYFNGLPERSPHFFNQIALDNDAGVPEAQAFVLYLFTKRLTA